MAVEIVPMEEKHIEGFAACLAIVAQERRWLGTLEGFKDDAARRFVLGMIENDDPTFVAVDGETIIGWIDIASSRRQISPHVGGLGMGIQKEYRGQGLGSRLMQVALDKARTKSTMKRIELEVFDHNSAAIKLYEKFGFKLEGRKENAALLDDGYHDLLFMALWITEPV